MDIRVYCMFVLVSFAIGIQGDSCTRSDCKKTKIGAEYEGYIHKTVSGKNCQRWDKQCPHKHQTQLTNPTEARNYCRNPDSSSGGPWCYTDEENKRWEYCDVPICECPWKGKCYKEGKFPYTHDGFNLECTCGVVKDGHVWRSSVNCGMSKNSD